MPEQRSENNRPERNQETQNLINPVHDWLEKREGQGREECQSSRMTDPSLGVNVTRDEENGFGISILLSPRMITLSPTP